MNTTEYFKHARSLGAFSASDCIELARAAAELDAAAEAKRISGPTNVSYEVLPDGSAPLRFSREVTVY